MMINKCICTFYAILITYLELLSQELKYAPTLIG